MGLIHELILISKEDYSSFDNLNIVRNELGKIDIIQSNIEGLVEINDKVFNYLSDFINWIPCYNTFESNESSLGLNYHGITYIKYKSANKFKNIFHSLLNLFLNAPEIITITGDYILDDEIIDGTYETIKIYKKDIINILKELVYLSEQMLKDKNLFIIHVGI